MRACGMKPVPSPVLRWVALALWTSAGCGPAPEAIPATGDAAVSMDVLQYRDGRGTVTTAAFSTSGANELLLAFVASDGPPSGTQRATVSGAGLTWSLVVRTNAQAGTSEIWKATAAAPLANVTVRSVPSVTGYDQSLTVVVLSGASGTGNVTGASAPSGAPAVTLLSSAAGSWVFGVGNDWDRAIPRTLGAGQTMVHEWTDTGVGDDFWVQRLATPTAAAGIPVLVNATAPSTDRWNLSAVEVLAAGTGPSPTPTPTFTPAPGTYPGALTVTISDAEPNATIYYTTDGSPPTSNSTVYAAPLAVNATTMIRAFAVAPGLGPSGVVAGQYVIQAEQMNGHGVVLDSSGKLLSWLPQESAYGQIVARVWNGFLNTIPTDEATGLKLYYLYPYVVPGTYQVPYWPHSPAGTYAMLTDSALLSYPFTGDTLMMTAIRGVLTYHLAHGMTAAGDSWSSVPYAEADPGSTTYAGARSFSNGIGDGAGVLEPDKVAELGYAWLRFWEFDGTAAFRDAAIRCADQLASHRRTSTSASVSPWPFRARASDGSAVEGYTAHVVAAIKLFDELIRLGLGDTASDQVARDAVWTWLMAYPMQNGVWCQYFEDVGIQSSYDANRNQYLPGNTARYLLEHPELDPQWSAHVAGIVAWIEANFGKPLVHGATPIGEQVTYDYEMGSHTSRYAAVNALLYERTGDEGAKEKAYRALNWASYQNRSDGITVDCNPFPNQVWFTDSFGDYARHFMVAMGAVPEWAPPTEDHLLRSSSVVQSVAYSAGRVEYRTFDSGAQEVLRLSFVPTAVLADGTALPQRTDLLQEGWTFDPTLGVLRIRHDAARAVAVVGASSVIAISPSVVVVPPRGSALLSATGGSGAGWTWALATNASGATIVAATGAYTAGQAGSVTDVAQVTDSIGNSATRAITVTAGASVSPATASTLTGGTIQFSASGGSGTGWTWTLPANASGATIAADTGLYTAGPIGYVSDVVQATDSLGNSATSQVAVIPAPVLPTISPPAASAPPRGNVGFTAGGGSGGGYAWALAINASGGAIDPVTGSYVAGATGSVTDLVRLTDSLGNTATAQVFVGPGMSILPSSASTLPGGRVSFTASGGSGAGFAWTLAANRSGGSLDAAGGYTAGPTWGVTDLVQATDSLGNSATATVAVAAPTSIGIDRTLYRDGRGTVTTAAFGTNANDALLLGFVASDGPPSGGQRATVSGAGLTWSLVARTNSQPGTSEIWKATAAAPLANVTVRSAPLVSGYDQSLTVVVLLGASGTGTVSRASALSGAPAVTLVSSATGSWVFAVGNDWDHAIARTLGTGQVMVHEWTDTGVGDDFWVQRLGSPTAAAGSSVLVNATAPTADRWNLSAVEVVPR